MAIASLSLSTWLLAPNQEATVSRLLGNLQALMLQRRVGGLTPDKIKCNITSSLEYQRELLRGEGIASTWSQIYRFSICFYDQTLE